MPRSLFRPLIAFFAVFLIASRAYPEAQPFPAIKGLEESKVYKVKAGKERVWVEGFRTSMDLATLPEWFTKDPRVAQQQEIHFADFAADGPTEIVITTRKRIKQAQVRPIARGIKPIIEGKRVRFTLPGPDKVYVEIDDLPPLCVFANPPTLPAPAAAPGVIVFEKGVHEPGLIELTDGSTVYLAPGALVYGGLRAKGAKGIRVFGAGILDGGYRHEDMVRFEDCEDVRVEGITIRNGIGWTNTLVHCRDIHFKAVKVISFGPSGDGINPVNSSDVSISGSFFRCTDDCVAIKAPDPRFSTEGIRVFGNTMIGYAFADGVTIGFETNAPSISDIQIQNCDILMARGGSRVDGHSAFSIVCDGPSRIHDILFSELRVEDVEHKLFELIVTDGTLYGADKPGHIGDVTIKSVQWKHAAPISLKGFGPSNRVSTVAFEGCTVAGKSLESIEDPIFRIGPHVSDVTVKP